MIGVRAEKGQSSYGQDQDDVVLIPFETAERKVLGVSAPSILMSSIVAPTPSPSNPLAGVPTSNSVYSQTTTLTSPFVSPPKIIGVVNVIMFRRGARSK